MGNVSFIPHKRECTHEHDIDCFDFTNDTCEKYEFFMLNNTYGNSRLDRLCKYHGKGRRNICPDCEPIHIDEETVITFDKAYIVRVHNYSENVSDINCNREGDLTYETHSPANISFYIEKSEKRAVKYGDVFLTEVKYECNKCGAYVIIYGHELFCYAGGYSTDLPKQYNICYDCYLQDITELSAIISPAFDIDKYQYDIKEHIKDTPYYNLTEKEICDFIAGRIN